MTLEEIRKLSVGDRVELTYVVEVVQIDRESESLPVLATIGGTERSDWIFAEAFANAKVLPAPFKVGERVTWGSGNASYPIVHIDGEVAVLYEHGTSQAIETRRLRRADA